MQGKYIYYGNIHVALFLRLLLLLVLFTLSRILFFLFNYSYFSDIVFSELLRILFYGIRFDISAILLVNSLYIILFTIPIRIQTNKIYRTICNFLFYFTNIIALATNFIDTIYFRFTGKRTTSDFINYIEGADDNILLLIPQFIIDFWYAFISCIVFIFLLVYLFTKIKIKSKQFLSNIRYYISYSILFLVFSFSIIIGVRGGFQLKPMGIIAAGQYTTAKNVPLVLNTPFTIIKTIGKQALEPVEYFKNKTEQENIWNPKHLVKKQINKGGFKPYNVIIFILESFSSEHIGALNPKLENGKYEGYTPFLDSLIEKSLVFNGFANGKRSIEAIPAILASLPTLMNNDYVTSIYSGNKINSLAGLLKKKGYNSAFYHGGINGTMNFDVFTKFAEFDNYFGKNEYNNDKDFDGKWGIFDEEFFQYVAGNLNQTQQPFLASVFSLSSHHPYTIPDKHKGRFKKGKLKIQQCVMYSDYALMKFFKTASKMSWFDSTLFVITADHTSEAYYPFYQNSVGIYAVPIIFYIPGGKLKGKSEKIAQQTDIMPSILDYLNYDESYIAFGESVFDTSSNRFVISCLNNTYQIIKDNYVLTFDGEKSGFLFDFKNDSLLQNNLINTNILVKEKMENLTKAIIQEYNNRIIENELTTE